MVQWLRIHMSMQETQVQSLVWGRFHMQLNPCTATTETSALESLCSAKREATAVGSPGSLQLEKVSTQQ